MIRVLVTGGFDHLELSNYCFESPNAFLQGSINQPTRMSWCGKSYKIFSSIIIPDSIQVMDSIAFWKKLIMIFFPYKNVFSHIASRSMTWFIFRIYSTSRMWLRMIYKYISAISYSSSTFPRRTVFTISMIAKKTFKTITSFIFPTKRLIAIKAKFVRFFVSFLIIYSPIGKRCLIGTILTVFNHMTRPVILNWFMTYSTFLNHIKIITHNNHINQAKEVIS